MATLADLPPDVAADLRLKLVAIADDFKRRAAKLAKEGEAGAWMLERLEVERLGMRVLVQQHIDRLSGS